MIGSAPLRLRMIGAVGTIDGCACNCYGTSMWKCEWSSRLSANSTFAPAPLSRMQLAHSRLSWTERLARNARERSAPAVALTLFGVPSATAHILGLLTIEETGTDQKERRDFAVARHSLSLSVRGSRFEGTLKDKTCGGELVEVRAEHAVIVSNPATDSIGVR